jgi:hypothetical protein
MSVTILHSDVPPMIYISGDRVNGGFFSGTNSNILLRRVDILSVYGKDMCPSYGVAPPRRYPYCKMVRPS